MGSGIPLTSKSTTQTLPLQPKYVALYTPTPEHWIAPGIPARNLTAGEVELYGLEALRNAQCYELVEVTEPAPEPGTDEPED